MGDRRDRRNNRARDTSSSKSTLSRTCMILPASNPGSTLTRVKLRSHAIFLTLTTRHRSMLAQAHEVQLEFDPLS